MVANNAVLISDSTVGIVGYLNVTTDDFGTSTFVFQERATPPGASFTIGVNGIRVRDSYLYWTNSFLFSLFRMPINLLGYSVPDAMPELVANLSSSFTVADDFAFGSNGGVYIATNFDNSVTCVDSTTRVTTTVVGSKDNLLVAGSTAVVFGKGDEGETLYVSTSGALAAPVNGTVTEGTKVVAVEIASSELPLRAC
ncbi:hypothetical protein SGCOL_001304 [Colletotrichum sp. CLE4]